MMPVLECISFAEVIPFSHNCNMVFLCMSLLEDVIIKAISQWKQNNHFKLYLFTVWDNLFTYLKFDVYWFYFRRAINIWSTRKNSKNFCYTLYKLHEHWTLGCCLSADWRRKLISRLRIIKPIGISKFKSCLIFWVNSLHTRWQHLAETLIFAQWHCYIFVTSQ